MNRYLIVFLTEGQFACQAVMAEDIVDAFRRFMRHRLAFEEIYSITKAP